MKPTTDEQLICKICKKQFDHLGGHIFNKHKMLAREYKRKFKINLTRPLVNPEISKKLHNHGIKYTEHIKKIGINTRIKKGELLTKDKRFSRVEKISDDERKRRQLICSENWRKNNREHFNKTHREYMRRHPEKRKMYQERLKQKKKNVIINI